MDNLSNAIPEENIGGGDNNIQQGTQQPFSIIMQESKQTQHSNKNENFKAEEKSTSFNFAAGFGKGEKDSPTSDSTKNESVDIGRKESKNFKKMRKSTENQLYGDGEKMINLMREGEFENERSFTSAEESKQETQNDQRADGDKLNEELMLAQTTNQEKTQMQILKDLTAQPPEKMFMYFINQVNQVQGRMNYLESDNKNLREAIDGLKTENINYKMELNTVKNELNTVKNKNKAYEEIIFYWLSRAITDNIIDKFFDYFYLKPFKYEQINLGAKDKMKIFFDIILKCEIGDLDHVEKVLLDENNLKEMPKFQEHGSWRKGQPPQQCNNALLVENDLEEKSELEELHYTIKVILAKQFSNVLKEEKGQLFKPFDLQLYIKKENLEILFKSDDFQSFRLFITDNNNQEKIIDLISSSNESLHAKPNGILFENLMKEQVRFIFNKEKGIQVETLNRLKEATDFYALPIEIEN